MGKVIVLRCKQHVYDLKHCAMCREVNRNDQIEVSFTTENEIRHISFCIRCYEKFLSGGVVNS